jgi:hypothetical protein
LAFPGIHVEAAEPGQELALAGSHRFSDCAYRALVIGTRGHVLVTNRILSAVRRRAERT